MCRSALMTFIAVLLAALAGCGEKPQTAATRKSDVAPYQGTGGSAYAAQGWKAGDQASWEKQMRTRAQGQDEYSRTASK